VDPRFHGDDGMSLVDGVDGMDPRFHGDDRMGLVDGMDRMDAMTARKTCEVFC
jgi:hypothetical protein